MPPPPRVPGAPLYDGNGAPIPGFQAADIPSPPTGPTRRDPRTPFGATPTQQLSVDDYAPPRPKAPLVIAVCVAVLALLAVLFVVTRPPAPAPSSEPNAPTATASPSWGLPFTTQNGRRSGEWQVLDSEWTDQGLRVQVRVAVDKGPLSVLFFAYTNDSADSIDPLPSSDFPGSFGTQMDSGDDKTGWLVFPMPRGDASIILADFLSQQQLSALPVKG